MALFAFAWLDFGGTEQTARVSVLTILNLPDRSLVVTAEGAAILKEVALGA